MKRLSLHIRRPLVRANVNRPDDNRFAGHHLRRQSIGLELFFLRRAVIRLQKKILASEKPDALSSVLQRPGHIRNAAHVGAEPNPSAALCDGFLVFVLREKPNPFLLFLLKLSHIFQSFLVRIHIEKTVHSVKDSHFAIPLFPHRNSYEGRKIHGPGQNRRVGLAGSLAGHKTQDLGLVHLNGLTGSQILRHHNHRLFSHLFSLSSAAQNADNPLGDILHISRFCPEIFILHAGKHPRKIVPGGSHGILGIDALGLDDIFHRIAVIPVLQHQRMSLKNRGVDLAQLTDCFFPQTIQLPDRLVPRGLVAFPLFFCVLHPVSLDTLLFFRIKPDPPGSDLLHDGPAFVLFHSSPFPFRFRGRFQRNISTLPALPRRRR